MLLFRLVPAIVLLLSCTTSLVAEELVTSHGKPAYEVVAGELWVVITKTGGHMTATFPMGKDRPPVAPYYVSPWQAEAGKVEPPLLSVLRGDFLLPAVRR